MNILIISDLHIGTGDKFDTFNWSQKDFIDAVEIISKSENIDKVILNGDIFELYKYTWDEIEVANKLLIDYFKSPQFVFIRGNHDAVLPFGEFIYKIRNSNKLEIHIEHGHAADFLSGSKMGRRIQTSFFNILKKLINYNWFVKTYFKIVEIDDYIHHIPKKYHTYRYLKYALKKLKKCDVVVLSHTHKLESHKIYYLQSKKFYLNTGSCQMGRFQGVILNTESLKHETIKFKNFNHLKTYYKN